MKNFKKLLSVFLMIMLLLQCASITALADGEITLSSTFDGGLGVPLTASVPLTFSSDVTLSVSDVTVTPAVTDAKLIGSGTSYSLSFTKSENTSYTVTAGGYGSISFTTAFDTAKPDNICTSSSTTATVSNLGEVGGQYNTFSFQLNPGSTSFNEGTRKCAFVDQSGTSKKWIRLQLSRNAETGLGNIVSYHGIGTDQNASENNTVAVCSGITYSDGNCVIYGTYANGKLYVYVSHGGGMTVATVNLTFTDGFTLTHAAVSHAASTGKISPINFAFKPAAELASDFDGNTGVPLGADVTVTAKNVVPTLNNVIVEENGAMVEGLVSEITAGSTADEYIIKFSRTLNEFTTYSIKADNSNEITFTTAFDTANPDNICTSSSTTGKVSDLGEVGGQYNTFSFQLNPGSTSFNEGTRKCAFVDQSGTSKKWIRLQLSRNATTGLGNIVSYHGSDTDQNASENNTVNVCSGIKYSDGNCVIYGTYANGKLYVYVSHGGGMTVATVNLTFTDGFTLTHAAVSHAASTGKISPINFAFPVESADYAISEPILKINDAVASAIAPGTLTVSANIRKITKSSSDSATLIVALYEKVTNTYSTKGIYFDKAVVNSVTNIDLSEVKTVTSDAITVPDDGKTYYAKVMFWIDTESVTPIANAVTFE